MSRHPEGAAVGNTHASSVMPVIRWSEAASATVTRALDPLNVKVLPYLPFVVQVAAAIVPALPLPEASATVVPDPSLKEYAATSPVNGGVMNVIALATFE